MNKYYIDKICNLTKEAYLVASNINLNINDRLSCIKFLLKLNNKTITLNYEGNEFVIHYAIFAIVALINYYSGPEIASEELLKFYPDLDSDTIFAALNSPMFDLTFQV